MKYIYYVLIIAIISLVGCTGNAATGKTTQDSFVEIPLSEISNEMTHYSFEFDGTQIRYFAVLDSKGNVKTAFDACDICGGSKGFHQEGNEAVCNNCGLKFGIDDLGQKNLDGGCWPSHLSHEIDGDLIRLRKSEIMEGKFRFV